MPLDVVSLLVDSMLSSTITPRLASSSLSCCLILAASCKQGHLCWCCTLRSQPPGQPFEVYPAAHLEPLLSHALLQLLVELPSGVSFVELFQLPLQLRSAAVVLPLRCRLD